MSAKNLISRLAIVGLTLLGLPGARALAAEPPEGTVRGQAPPPVEVQTTRGELTAQTAAARADAWDRQVEAYRSAGVMYKSGLVRFAESRANEYRGEAARLSATPLSTEAARSMERVAQLDRMGAVAYKTGLRRWAEEEGRSYGPASSTTPAKGGLYHTTPPFKPWLN
jgi:hypothetical protein